MRARSATNAVDELGMESSGAKLMSAMESALDAPELELDKVYEAVGHDDGSFIARVVELGYTTEKAAYRIYAENLGLEFVEPMELEIESDTLRVLPADMIRCYRALPVGVEEDGLMVGMADPFDLLAVDAIQEFAGCPIVPTMCPPAELEQAIEYHLRESGGVQKLLESFDVSEIDESAFANPQKLKDAAGDGAIVELVDHILENAVRRKASDIHVEPSKEWVRVRVRIDGKLEVHLKLPGPLHAAIVSRIKILSGLDIAERRKPQDGRFELLAATQRRVQFRVSTLPAVYGEKVVLRVLDKGEVQLDFGQLGFREGVAAQLTAAASYPTGLVLVTGPTGSGKTTTLYGVLSFLNNDESNLITVEDPVEHELTGITQVAVDERAERTFASCLRSILRQDPDVIMVGEIRDRETATTAIHAGLTGHMVLSTLHTNSALGTVTRMVDMGVEPFLLAPTLRAVAAQRLVRKLCPQCAEPSQPDPQLLAMFGLPEDAPGEFRRPVGCKACRGRGYSGRAPIQELLVWSTKLGSCLSRGGTEEELSEIALAEGFETMLTDGALKAAKGLTSLEEVLTATRG